ASSNLSVISAQTPALAEKAAASVLIVVVALTGSGAPSTPSNVGVAIGGVPKASKAKAKDTGGPTKAGTEAATARKSSDGPQAANLVKAKELVASLPQTITSTIEGHDRLDSNKGDKEDTSRGEDETIPPTVKETPDEARRIVKKVIEEVVDP
ncbi:MAG: hypothetical protein KY438_10300, partial [Actinobacteria bacterium]|nr:hypothetical protein [Actinomycetota bacterium]